MTSEPSRFGALMSPGLKPRKHKKIVTASAKHDGHLIRKCTRCGRDYVADHYYSQCCSLEK